jgi:hypothetical protein
MIIATQIECPLRSFIWFCQTIQKTGTYKFQQAPDKSDLYNTLKCMELGITNLT